MKFDLFALIGEQKQKGKYNEIGLISFTFN